MRGPRAGVVETAKAMSRSRLTAGTSGNVSVRTKKGMLITPSGVPYEALKPKSIVAVSADGQARGALRPSSEWRFHLGIYAAHPEANAIVHTHSDYATALACTGRGIPAFHYMVAVAGGRDIPCAPYATFGTEELAENAVRVLEERRACLLANHGQIALGETPAAALKLAEEVEALARHYVFALSIGDVAVLDDAEMDRVLERFEG
ncbi:MAG: class II aldolase/adducin family protein, partial [Alphaproteobacteria bacterium]